MNTANKKELAPALVIEKKDDPYYKISERKKMLAE
jgi:hypothetical protein